VFYCYEDPIPMRARRLNKQLKTLKQFIWEILSSPRLMSETELQALRDKAEALLMAEPVPERLKELTSHPPES